MSDHPKEPEVFDVMHKLRYDLTAAQSKVTTALNMLAALSWPIPGKVECTRCGVYLGGPRALEDHLANVHGDYLVSTAADPARVERSQKIENDENSRGIR